MSSSAKSTAVAVKKVSMPDVLASSESMIVKVTDALGLPRDILPSDDQIRHAWDQLPRLLTSIPPERRDERLVKMCVAVSCGLFDAGINYVWNAAVLELRNKVRHFGIEIIPQVLDKSNFDESTLVDLKDSELLDLCLKLNLIGDDDFFFLDQCRATRNNFSAAHPADGAIDEYEFINFVNRCRKHALVSQKNPKGVDVRKLITALKAGRFTKDQRDEWLRRIEETFDAQRELIFPMLHGIYCDPAAGEEARNNALTICEKLAKSFSPKARSALIDQHQDYKAKGEDKRASASSLFFEKIGLLGLLGEAEVHGAITKACQKLLTVHNGFDNFYNEPPFAERLAALSEKNSVPNTAQAVFVEAVITCGIGNQYGVSHAAMPSYRQMVRSFSPAEIQIMFQLTKGTGTIAARLKNYEKCRTKFKSLVGELSPKSVPTAVKADFGKWSS
ncbi:hypothetical protein [Oceaniradius stylonematis]|uniref:hypothetical protein n=1 Tax=Oceaniradius stylonematis TaxID=2184161 RepID=UPI00273EE042|nr:hypothetical protein [Oceaniradius stylonematis]